MVAENGRFIQLFADVLTLVYHCVDRIVIHLYRNLAFGQVAGLLRRTVRWRLGRERPVESLSLLFKGTLLGYKVPKLTICL
jgi:hypothetical protein